MKSMHRDSTAIRPCTRIVLTALCCAALAGTCDASPKQAPQVDMPAPDFQLTTFDGRKISLSDLKGQVVVLNFWATWCGPCKQEMPLLDAYYRKFNSKGIQIFAVATEDSLTPYQLRPVAKLLSFPLVKYFKGGYGEIKFLPTNFVIDRQGILRYAESGGFTLDSINETLGPLVAESAR
jgi:cytochrome c biogenesis protein CcmG/thiol:disulfide interchange protein DsbE